MIKKLLLTCLCISTTATYGISDLKKAVDTLDVEEAVKILDNDKQAPTESEVIIMITELSAQIQRANRESIGMAALGLLSGGTAGYFLGRRPEVIDGRVRHFLCTVAGALAGQLITSFFSKDYPYNRAHTLLHFLLKRISREEIIRLTRLGLISFPLSFTDYEMLSLRGE